MNIAVREALKAAEQCIGELSPTQARVEAMQMIQAALEPPAPQRSAVEVVSGFGEPEAVDELRIIQAELAEMPADVRNLIDVHATHFREYLKRHGFEPKGAPYMALALVGAEIAAGELKP
jgi:hypothetical protein